MTSKELIEKLKSLKKSFDDYDENKDGLISKDELRKAYKKNYPEFEEETLEGVISDIWKESDVNGDGFIDFEEYISKEECKLKKLTSISMEKLKLLKEYFDDIDENKDGKLSQDELRKAYKKNYPELEDDEMLEGIINEIWSEADADGDGFIDFGEYVAMEEKKMKAKE